MLRCDLYARSHCPALFAAAIAFNPADCICPRFVSSSALSRFRFDQMLRSPRGVNFWSHHAESYALFCPSIQPQQSATSRASAYDTDPWPEPFFAILSHTPANVCPFFRSHSFHSVSSLKRRMGRPSFLRVADFKDSPGIHQRVSGSRTRKKCERFSPAQPRLNAPNSSCRASAMNQELTVDAYRAA